MTDLTSRGPYQDVGKHIIEGLKQGVSTSDLTPEDVLAVLVGGLGAISTYCFARIGCDYCPFRVDEACLLNRPPFDWRVDRVISALGGEIDDQDQRLRVRR
jgi:hypothetical protein